MRGAAHIYVIQCRDYVKFGITDRPLHRLKEHAGELDEDLSFHSLWRIEADLYEAVELEVGSLLSGYSRHSKERIKAPIEVVVEAVHEAAARHGATLRLLDRKISVRKPLRTRPIRVALSADELAALKAAYKGQFRGVNDLVRRAVLEFIEIKKTC